MAIKLHGTVGSTATFRALTALYEKDLDVEFIPVNLGAKEHKSPHFLAQSRAITKYVAKAYANKGTSLLFEDPKKCAIQSMWMEVESQKFDPPSSKLGWELFFKPIFGMTTDEAAAADLEKQLEPVLDVYESRLTECKYLGGDSFTLADLHHIPNVHVLMGTKAKNLFDARPHVSSWVSDILSRPSWAKVTSMLPK